MVVVDGHVVVVDVDVVEEVDVGGVVELDADVSVVTGSSVTIVVASTTFGSSGEHDHGAATDPVTGAS